MKPETHVDVAVLGAGCAGLAAACELAGVMGEAERLMVIDAKQEFTDDRTWCGWGLPGHGFTSAVSKTWPKSLVRGQGREVLVAPRRHAYRMIRAKDYYDAALALLAGKAQMRLGERVLAVEALGEPGVAVTTTKGTVTARRVVDARWDMEQAAAPPGGLVQDFLGQTVRVDRDVFDPETATLMDFDVRKEPGGVHFVYVLPFSEREALVEPTVFGLQGLSPEAYRSRIGEYLWRRFGVEEFSVLREERGTIPMGEMAQPPEIRGVTVAGTRAGCVKPSSGYGFHACQRQARALARSWQENRFGAAQGVRPPLAGFLDRVFVSALRHDPESAPGIFMRLFERVDADRLARFLSDVASPADYAAVIAAVPARPMLVSVGRMAASPKKLAECA